MYIHFGNERWNQAAAFALRYEVFVIEQGISSHEEFDLFDTAEKSYYVIYNDSIVIATARFQVLNKNIVQPDRLCVKKEYRRKGLVTKLLTEIEYDALQQGISTILLSAETTALKFYQKLGYVSSSKEYYEDGLRCIQMRKNLNNAQS